MGLGHILLNNLSGFHWQWIKLKKDGAFVREATGMPRSVPMILLKNYE